MRKKLLICILILSAALILALLPGSHIAGQAASLEELERMMEEAAEADDPVAAYRDLMEYIHNQKEDKADEIKAKEREVGAYLGDISDLEAELVVLSQQVALVQQAIDLTVLRIEQAAAAIRDAEQRLAERQALLADRVVDIYVNGNIDLIDVIFESASFEDFLILYDMADLIMRQDKRLVNQISRERDIIEANQRQLNKDLDSQIELKNQYSDMQADLAALIAAKEAAIGEANLSIAELERQLDAWDQYAVAAGEQMRDAMASSGYTGSFGGSMVWPLPTAWGPEYITSPYGMRNHPVTGTPRFHAGIDIGADGGTPIYAASAGEVIYVGWQAGYGNTVMINHGSGVGTLYGHMSSFGSFSVGDYVVPFDTIGYVGTTGVSTGNHLHFEVRLNGNHTDPQPYLNY